MLLPQTRQRLGFKKGNMFEPTPNVRNPHMLEVCATLLAGCRSRHAYRLPWARPMPQVATQIAGDATHWGRCY